MRSANLAFDLSNIWAVLRAVASSKTAFPLEHRLSPFNIGTTILNARLWRFCYLLHLNNNPACWMHGSEAYLQIVLSPDSPNHHPYRIPVFRLSDAVSAIDLR